MKNKLKTLMVILLAITISACQQLDVVANYAVSSFAELTAELPENVAKEDGGFTISSPAKTERFFYGKNMRLELNITPFINAGLDINQLDEAIVVEDGYLVLTADIVGAGGDDAMTAFEQVVRSNRKALNYHMDHDVFEILLGEGNAFRWAKDMSTNTRDMVFVLNPTHFIEAGLDAEKLDGWRLTNVPVVDDNGGMTEALRLLKPYNIK